MKPVTLNKGPYFKASEIKQWLKKTPRLYSHAAGRWGEIVGTKGKWVYLRFHGGKTVGVTTFARGDKVKLVIYAGDWIIVNR